MATAQRIADANTINKDGTFVSDQQINDFLRKDPRVLADPKLRDQVDERMHKMAAQNRQAVEQSQRGVFDDVLGKVQGGMDVMDPYAQTHRAGMSPEQWSIIESRARRETPEPDPVAVHDMEMKLSDPETRMAYAKMDLTRMGVDPNSKAIRPWARCGGGHGHAYRSAAGCAADADRLSLQSRHLDEGRAGLRAPYLAMNRQLLNWEAGSSRISKKKPTTDERQQEIDRLLTKQVIDDTRAVQPRAVVWDEHLPSRASASRIRGHRSRHTAPVPGRCAVVARGEFQVLGRDPALGPGGRSLQRRARRPRPRTPERSRWISRSGRRSWGTNRITQRGYAKLKRWTTGQAEEGSGAPARHHSARGNSRGHGRARLD